MLLLWLVGSLALHVRAWQRLAVRVDTGKLTKLRALVRYAGWALTPLLAFVGFFLAAVGLEEWSGMALIGESMARATLPIAVLLAGLAGTAWIAFAARCALIKNARSRDA